MADVMAPTGSTGASSQRKAMAGPAQPAPMAALPAGQTGAPPPSFAPPPIGQPAGQWGPAQWGSGQWGPPAPSVPIKPGWSGARVAAVVGAVVLALGAAYGVFMATRGGPRIVMPDSIVGINKIDTPASQQAVKSIRDEAKKRGWNAQAALYGYSETQPSLVVLTIASHVSESPQALMSDFTASAADPNNRLKLNLPSITQTTRDGATFICGRLQSGPKDSACVWKDDKVFGFVAERALSMDPMDLAAAVRTAVES